MSHGGIKAGIKMPRKEVATWRQNHVVVCCGHFKNRQPAAGERLPRRSLALRIARAAEHRDVTDIRLVHIGAACPKTKPVVVSSPIFIRNGSPQSKPQI